MTNLEDVLSKRRVVCSNVSQTGVWSSSVARGGGAPPLACEVCKIAPFWWF